MIIAPKVTAAVPASTGLPSSRELAALFQEEFVGATGFPARWAADKVQGNRRLEHIWNVPFEGERGLKGVFSLRWDGELQRYLAGRLGASAGRPEYLGAILRSAAGRWASWQALKAGTSVRLQPTPAEEHAISLSQSPWQASAALIVDSFVLELCFALESSEA